MEFFEKRKEKKFNRLSRETGPAGGESEETRKKREREYRKSNIREDIRKAIPGAILTFFGVIVSPEIVSLYRIVKRFDVSVILMRMFLDVFEFHAEQFHGSPEIPGLILRPVADSENKTSGNIAVKRSHHCVFNRSYGIGCHARIRMVIALPFLGKIVLYAHQVGHP